MSPTWTFIFLLVALVAFLLAAAGIAVRRVNLIALGLAAWVFVPFVVALKAM